DGSVVDGGKAARFGPKRSLTSVNDRSISSSIRFNRNLLLAFKTGTTNFTSCGVAFSTDTAAGKPRRSAPAMILVPSLRLVSPTVQGTLPCEQRFEQQYDTS